MGSLRRAVDVFRDYMDADNYIIAPRALTEPVATGDAHAPEGMEASGEHESGREFSSASEAPQEPYATLVHQSLSIDIDDHPQAHGNGYSLDDAADDEHGTAEDKAVRKAVKARQRRDNRARRAQVRKEVVAKSAQASKKAVAKTAHSSRAAAAKTAHTSRAVAAKTAHTSRAAAVKTGQASRHAYNSSKQAHARAQTDPATNRNGIPTRLVRPDRAVHWRVRHRHHGVRLHGVAEVHRR